MTPHRKSPETLRSARWLAPDDLRGFGHRSRAMQMGYDPQDWGGKPVIALSACLARELCRRTARLAAQGR